MTPSQDHDEEPPVLDSNAEPSTIHRGPRAGIEMAAPSDSVQGMSIGPLS